MCRFLFVLQFSVSKYIRLVFTIIPTKLLRDFTLKEAVGLGRSHGLARIGESAYVRISGWRPR